MLAHLGLHIPRMISVLKRIEYKMVSYVFEE